MTDIILANLATSVSELKKRPMQIIREANGEPVAILNRNQPVFYCISPRFYELLLEKLDDEDLVNIIRSREGEKEIGVSLDDLSQKSFRTCHSERT